MTIDELLPYFKNVRSSGNGRQYTACCPAHDDRQASLSIGVGSDGKIMLHCFAGCSPESIMGRLGLKVSDLFQTNVMNSIPSGKPIKVAEYVYKDMAAPGGR